VTAAAKQELQNAGAPIASMPEMLALRRRIPVEEFSDRLCIDASIQHMLQLSLQTQAVTPPRPPVLLYITAFVLSIYVSKVSVLQ
jgi:hypothetical protein